MYNNLGKSEDLALTVNDAIILHKGDGWRGNQAKENIIKQAIYNILGNNDDVENIFAIVKQQRDY